MFPIVKEKRMTDLALLTMHALKRGLVVFFVLGWCVGGAAYGQEFSLYRKEILLLFSQGESLVVQKKYNAALLKLQAASALYQQMIEKTQDAKKKAALQRRHASLIYIIGRTYQYNKQWGVAHSYYVKSFLLRPGAKLEALLRKQIQLLAPQVMATLLLRSTPSGAMVKWQDQLGHVKVGKTPVSWDILPGKGTLWARKEGYQTSSMRLTISAGATIVKAIVLQRPLVQLKLTSTPPAFFTLRGAKTYQGATPYQRALPPGTYALVLKQQGYQTRHIMLQLKPGTQSAAYQLQRKRVHANASARFVTPQRRTAILAVGWISAGLSVLGLGSGAGLMIAGNQAILKYNENAGKPANQDDASSLLQSHDSGGVMQTFSVVSFSIAGVLAGVAVTMFVLGRDRASKQAQLVPRTTRANATTTPRAAHGLINPMHQTNAIRASFW